MPVDFHLGPSEAATRAAAASFAQHVLKPRRSEYLQHARHHERFQASRPIYAAAVDAGLIKGQIAPAHGGSGGSLVEAVIMVEECYAEGRVSNKDVDSTAYDPSQPFAELLNTAVVLPIFDGGNVGIRRRHLQQLMLSLTYGPSEQQ